MKARPILFSGEMVRALLDGRKTQTRRIIALERIMNPFPSKYGQAGDLLWVRESFGEDYTLTREVTSNGYTQSTPVASVVYKADNHIMSVAGTGWKPSIYMPKCASRLTLEITGVRVERLHQISVEDCIAEGLSTKLREHDACCDLKEQYQALWESLKGPESWQANPWVWVIEFNVHHKNVGEMLQSKPS